MTFAAVTRQRFASGAVASAIVLAFTTYLVWQHLGFVDDLDAWFGDRFVEFTAEHDAVFSAAKVISAAFGTIAMTGYTVAVCVLLLLRGFWRTTAWVVVVMVGASLSTVLLKILVDRPRAEDALVTTSSGAFPSGHASGIAAAAGIGMVLSTLFVRRRNQRRWVTIGTLLVAGVVGVDRLLLGVHGITDVVAGYALGVLWVCAAAYLFDPAPRIPLDTTLPSGVAVSRSLAVILNPIKVDDPTEFKALVDQRAAELGWEQPVWFETTIDDPGTSMAHEAAVGGAALVLVCGGDGTVRTVSAELAGTGIPVGVIPAGTGNLLARNLDLPLYLRGALDVALSGQDRAIDLVRIEGDGLPEEHFLVMAGMGFDAAIMEGANDQIKAKFGWLAYVYSALQHLMFPAIRVEISIDGGPFTKHRARTIVVGNVGFLQAGLPLLPDATIDDGRIDLVLVNPRRFLSWLNVVLRVVSRSKQTDDTVNRMTGRRIEIRAAHATPRQIDGDPVGAGTTLVCECLPGKLLVRVPR